MEEKKKIVDMKGFEVDSNENQQEQPKEYSRDELKQICNQLQTQVKQMQNYIQNLHQQINQMGAIINDKRIDCLFRVIEICSKENQTSEYACFAKDFVEKCIQEIQEVLTIPEQPQAESTKERN